MTNPILDMLGEEIVIGDFIIIPHHEYRQLQVVEIIGFTPKKIKIKPVINGGLGSLLEMAQYKYVKVDPKSVTFMMLKKKMK